MDAERTRATFVYLARDAEGALLYIGISYNSDRLATHSRASSWWPLVANLEIQHFSSRAEASAREAELIKAHRPPWNTMLVGGPTADQVEAAAPGCLTVEGAAAWLRTTPTFVAAIAAEIGGHEVLVQGRPIRVFTPDELRSWVRARAVCP